MKNIQLMNIQKQHFEHQEGIESAVLNVLRSGCYIGGSEVEAFESEFAEYEGAKYGISCGNGTDALVLALRALGIGAGDEVITTDFTFFATAESIAAVGAKPVFVDIDLRSYCIDTSLIENRITKKTKAIIAVHFYGHSCNMDVLRTITKRYGLKLITDCAQSVGTEYNGSRANTLGDISCFSFFPTKVLGCDGDGGMILTNDSDIATACRSLKVHGSGLDGYKTLKRFYELNDGKMPETILKGNSKYYNYLVGYNTRLDTIQAAILRVKLRYVDTYVERRRKNADFYSKSLVGTGYITPIEAEYTKHAYYIYCLRHPNTKVIVEKLKESGIQCGIYYPIPMHLQGAFVSLDYKETDFPKSDVASKTTFAIPVYPELEQEEIEYIVDILKKCDA